MGERGPKLGYKPWFHKATGYMYVYAGRENGKRRVMPYHRFLMEQHLGRRLETHEHIHHINGDRLDNRIENLELTTQSDHSRHHWRTDWTVESQLTAAHQALIDKGYEPPNPEQKARALEMYAAGLKPFEIASVLGRKYHTVYSWVVKEPRQKGVA